MSNQEGVLNIPANYPKFPGSKTLPTFPTLHYVSRPINADEEVVLGMVRPYLNDVDTMLIILDTMMSYYHDELVK